VDEEPTDPIIAPTLPTTHNPAEEPTNEDPPEETPADEDPPAAPVEIAGVRRSTRTCTAPTRHTPSFTGKTYNTSNLQLLHPDTHLSFLTHEAFASPTYSQVIATIMTQLSLKAGLKAWAPKHQKLYTLR
jgi:hypothetical protein